MPDEKAKSVQVVKGGYAEELLNPPYNFQEDEPVSAPASISVMECELRTLQLVGK